MCSLNLPDIALSLFFMCSLFSFSFFCNTGSHASLLCVLFFLFIIIFSFFSFTGRRATQPATGISLASPTLSSVKEHLKNTLETPSENTAL
jgi:hypothetical protein